MIFELRTFIWKYIIFAFKVKISLKVNVEFFLSQNKIYYVKNDFVMINKLELFIY